jgi:predicted Zn-dependent protease
VRAALEGAPPDDPMTARLRGLALLSQEDYSAAAVTLGQAFAITPNHAPLAFVLGWARVGAGDRTGAITAFRNAALLDPKMVAAHLALAETYVALGHTALAVQSLEAGLQAVPQSVELQRALARIRERS